MADGNWASHRGRAVLTATVVCGLSAPPAAAQVQGYPVRPRPDPPAVSAAPRPSPAEPPPIVGLPVYPETPAFRAARAPEAEPVPPDPAGCGDPFKCMNPNGGALSLFPRTLFWEPPLAIKREPRFAFLATTLYNDVTQYTFDITIGNTIGLFRYEPANSPVRVQVDLFAVVISRISRHDYLVGSDYRGGIPITFACGPWHAKLAYEHTSTHLGDETLVRTGREPFDYIKDEVVFGVGRWLFDYSLRVYADAGWAVSQFVPGDPSPFRFDLGAEWYCRRATGFWGQPFAATNLEFNGSVGYNPSFTLQGGWQWRDPDRRLSQVRVYAEYFTGRSPFGQFFQEREHWIGLGIAADY